MNSSKTLRRQIKVGNRVVGEIIDSTLFKRVRGSKHMLKRPPAWAWDVTAIEQAQILGTVTVSILDTETGVLYSVPLVYFLQYGTRFNRGYGDQIYLPLRQWQTVQTGTNRR